MRSSTWAAISSLQFDLSAWCYLKIFRSFSPGAHIFAGKLQVFDCSSAEISCTGLWTYYASYPWSRRARWPALAHFPCHFIVLNLSCSYQKRLSRGLSACRCPRPCRTDPPWNSIFEDRWKPLTWLVSCLRLSGVGCTILAISASRPRSALFSCGRRGCSLGSQTAFIRRWLSAPSWSFPSSWWVCRKWQSQSFSFGR